MVSRQQIEESEDPLYLVTSELIPLVTAVALTEQSSFVLGLSPGRRIVWGWFMVDGEVNNGGFNQLFWNDSRRSVSLAREAFQLIGATDHLQLLDEAVARLDANLDLFKRYAVLRTLDAFSESYAEGVFDDLDRRYFDLDADPLLVAYIRSHPEEFAA